MTTVLLTGANGQVGWELARALPTIWDQMHLCKTENLVCAPTYKRIGRNLTATAVLRGFNVVCRMLPRKLRLKSGTELPGIVEYVEQASYHWIALARDGVNEPQFGLESHVAPQANFA